LWRTFGKDNVEPALADGRVATKLLDKGGMFLDSIKDYLDQFGWG
jgi:hypothetical protein